MKNISTKLPQLLSPLQLLSVALFFLMFAPLNAQVTEDFESIPDGAFTGNSDWTIDDGAADQGSRSASINITGLDFSNSAFNIDGGSRALELNLPEATGSDPANDFAVFDFSSNSIGSDGDVVEFRYLFSKDSTNSFTNIGISGDVTAARPSRTSSAGFVAAVTGGNNENRARIWDNNGNDKSQNLATDFNDGNTHLVAGQVTFNASGDETFDLWVDPTSTDLSTLTPTASVTDDMETTSFEAWGFFPNGDDNGTLKIDEFQAQVVPEPSTYATIMGVLALVGIAILRMRRTA